MCFLQERCFYSVEIILCSLLFLFLIYLPHFAHQITAPVTMQLRSVSVNAQIFNDIILIKLKTCIYREL
jgi:hypothetical protein